MKLSTSKWRVVLVFWVIAGVIAFLTYRDVYATFRDPIDLNQAQITDVKDMDHVKMDVSLCIGAAFQETTTTKSKWTGKEKSSSEKRYYLIPMFKETSDSVSVDRVFVIKVGQNRFNMYENATEKFWNYLDDEYATLPTDIIESVDGRIQKMGKEESDYLARALTEYGLDSSMVGAYYVEPLLDKNALMVMMGVAGVCFVIGLLLAIFWRRNKNF